MRLGKKATEFGTALLVLLTLFLFIWASIELYKKVNNLTPIGDIQYKLINTYDNGEKIQYYIDESAKMASYEALNNLADNGGASSDDCGEYFGSTLLVNETYNCLPEDNDVSPEFEYYLFASMRGYLSKFNGYNLNSGYAFLTYPEKKTTEGIADDKVILPISGTKISDTKQVTEYISTPGNFFKSPFNSEKFVVTSCFGYRGDEAGEGASKNHGGVDIRAPLGTPLYAVASGKIISAQKNPDGTTTGDGILGIDIGNGLIVEYLHMDKILVNIGDAVKTGDLVGKSGGMGQGKRNRWTPHLHLQLKSGSTQKLSGDIVVNGKINPLCFFDSSKISFKDLTKGACANVDPIKNGCDIYRTNGITLPEKKIDDSSVKQDDNSQVILNTGAICSGVNSVQLKAKLKGTKFDECVQYIDLIEKYSKENKLDYNIALLTAVVYGESACKSSIDKGGGFGLMQVTSVWKDKYPNYKGNAEEQIKAGIGIIKQYTDEINKIKNGLDQSILIRLVLYGYNRGNHKDAAKLMKDEGLTLMQAMTKACQSKYTGVTCSDSKTPKNLCVNGKDSGTSMCTGPKLGANYPDAILKNYEDICKAAGGTIEQGFLMDSSSQAAVYGSVGEYSFTPAFKVDLGYDLSIYKKIYDALFKLNNNYNQSTDQKIFLKNIVDEAKKVDQGILWSDDCDSAGEKAFYSFTEQYNLCAQSRDNNCYCEIYIPKNIEAGTNGESFGVSSSDSGVSSFSLGDNEENINGALPGQVSYPIGSPSLLKINSINFKKNSDSDYSLTLTDGIMRKTYGSLSFGEPLILFKSKKDALTSFISFIDPQVSPSNSNYKDALLDWGKSKQNTGDHPACNIKKDTVKLCVNTGVKIPTYDATKKAVVFKENVIKFAFMFKDLMPPPLVEQVSTGKNLLSEKEAIITWKQNDPEGDTNKFVIFTSNEDISGYTFEELSGKLSGSVDKKEFKMDGREIISSIDLQNPQVKLSDANVPEVKYNSAKGEIMPTKDALYEIETKDDEPDQYFSRISLLSNDKYNIAIAAVDKFGNVKMKDDSGKRGNLISIVIKDTMPPATMPLDGFTFSVAPNEAEKKVEISWPHSPTKNIDGSPFDADSELDHYNLYFMQGDMTSSNFFSSGVVRVDRQYKTQTLTAVDLTKKSCFYVVPVDKSGNMQFNEDTKKLMTSDKFFKPLCIDGNTAS